MKIPDQWRRARGQDRSQPVLTAEETRIPLDRIDLDHHNAEAYVDAYLAAAQIGDDRRARSSAAWIASVI